MDSKTKKDLQIFATQIRMGIIEGTYNAKAGHPGGSLSSADVFAYLYGKEMKYRADEPRWDDRDRFVLSKGHASPCLYAALAERGLLHEDLLTFRKLNSNLQGHPNMNSVAGVDMSTGSLGQGISAAVGMAIANKLGKNDHRIYAMLGDGECEEGQVWEAAMAASHYHLDNLCAIVDFNGLQIDGNVQDVMDPTPIDKKFEAFGWNTINIDGHDFDDIRNAFKVARECKGKPTMILAHTIKGKGVSYMENAANWHGVAPNEEQLKIALEELEGK